MLYVDRCQELFDWWKALKRYGMLQDQKNYKIMVQGIFEKNNTIIEKKEGNDMLESLSLIDLYASKQKQAIEEETKRKIDELRSDCDFINEFKKLFDQFQEDCKNLYLSQFTEEEKEKMLTTDDFNDKNMPITKNGYGGFNINLDFKPKGYCDLMEECNKELCKIDDLVKAAKAHVSIAKTKEEVEDILIKYSILDTKGKLKV